ncbi:MAG: benzoyl-CoA-dihydrodiol lyase [Gammaproteobacteria bacterium]|nr:benzoyl-CoA-dihydrodiol lyase [Gammaproteobacteria bacterium]
MQESNQVDYQTDPSKYQHWKIAIEAPIAYLSADVNENGGLRPGYKLKLNSYDLGVDIELNDALNRIRFEHPEVRTVIITSAKDRVFCSGANIFMLGSSSHAWKVNFCKFTNETRNGIEDSSANSGLKFIAAINGVCAGGGYELALACDEIILIDDRSSAVSLPEVPLLGVLPGTGGLTRLTDKRQVRHDLADIFCTTAEGIRGQKAKDWRLVDDIVKPAVFDTRVRERALELSELSDRPANSRPVLLQPVEREKTGNEIRYQYVSVEIDRKARTASFTISMPTEATAANLEDFEEAGADWYPLRLAQELDDAILWMRTNELETGVWLINTRGEIDSVLSMDQILLENRDHWFVRETIGYLRRVFGRLDVSSRSLFAIIDEGSCFAGSFFELALACDRSYHLSLPGEDSAPNIALSEINFGALSMLTGESRLVRRFYGNSKTLDLLKVKVGKALDADSAYELGLVTINPDELDWDDEIRIAIEERVSMSPDALTGMESNLRFNGQETMLTRIFGRLTAWQNWIFQRPNATGESGSLKLYGSGEKAKFDWDRV